MPIPLPNLDDRRWADLVEQARALIPLHSPEWTDHNASDPGVTLIELFAWLTEMDVYHVNRISDRQKRLLLSLLGIRPVPPQPCAIAVQLGIASGPEPVSLPAGLELTGSRLDGRTVAFQLQDGVNVVAAGLRAIQRASAGVFTNMTAAWTRQEPIAVFGNEPGDDAAFYLGFDRALPAATWSQLVFRVLGDKAAPAEARRILENQSGTSLPRHHSVRVKWEHLAADGQWVPLESTDHTRAFTLSGRVRLRPGGMAPRAIGRVAAALYYLRCRVVGGAFDEAPQVDRVFLNGVELGQFTPVWQTWPIAAGTTVSGSLIPGQATAIDLQVSNGVITKLSADSSHPDSPQFLVIGYAAPTALTAGYLAIQAMLAGTGTGEPEQTFTLARRPPVEHTIELFSLESGAWRTWERVDDFSASTRQAAHFLLDPTTGEMTFGDGEHGRTPPAGSLLVARYDATAAEAGMAQISAIADSPANRVLLADPGVIARVTVAQQFTLEDGAAAETIGHAIGRAIESREAPARAITVQDFEALTLDTPGARIARAIARPNFYPGVDCVRAPGVVTVVAVPSLPGPRPSPSPA